MEIASSRLRWCRVAVSTGLISVSERAAKTPHCSHASSRASSSSTSSPKNHWLCQSRNMSSNLTDFGVKRMAKLWSSSSEKKRKHFLVTSSNPSKLIFSGFNEASFSWRNVDRHSSTSSFPANVHQCQRSASTCLAHLSCNFSNSSGTACGSSLLKADQRNKPQLASSETSVASSTS